MFDRLVLSSKDQRKGRTGKFLFVTSLFYSLALASALVVSVVAASPMLYERMDVIRVALPPPPPPPLGVRNPTPNRPQSAAVRPPSIYNPTPLEQLNAAPTTRSIANAPTTLPTIGDVGNVNGIGQFGDPNGVRDGIGPVGGNILGLGSSQENIAPPPPPLVTKPAERVQTPEKQVVRLTSQVLTGKAIERRTPAYPILAKQIHVEGSITVEIVISVDGRVESARALGGHPLLMSAAVEAARGWRFQPTLLNDTPVRVTGVITFNFKLQ